MSELSATPKSTLIGCDENELLHYLHDRYTANHIYTYVGSILIAVNPHQQADNLSVYEQIKDYQQSRDIMPHIFIVGDKAYHDMIKKNQSIIILGELGAGKTETSKCVLQYLTESYSGGNDLMKERFIKCNLLLEAFGNAKTIHNNSSRFGKIFEVHFNNEYQIVGGILSYYLFEKSRVCVQTKGEENYHIFYHLCVNAPEDIRNTLQLSSPHNFYYLNHEDYNFTSKQLRNPRPDNITDFIKYDRIMDCIDISQQDKFNIYNTLALILHLGNINFENDPKSTQYECKIISMSEQALTITAKLLNVNIDDLRNALTTKISMINKTVISCPLTVLEAQTVRDKLAKTIYARLFNQIVDFVNKSISFNSSTSYISIHDTIGFEYVHIGSFEQFCINYYNEKIHKFRNDHLVKNEILCEEEDRILNKLGFTNTEECINLFEAPITGCFYLLDEESKLPEPTSAHFTNEVYSKNKGHAKLKRPQILRSVTTTRKVPDNHDFLIKHFSGDVSYSTTQFIEKNIDILPYSLITLIHLFFFMYVPFF
ncbi:unnamed protein product [Rotaria sp. Silwood2]|nr:unnamed protein product [Rotaria sp. Silwood2]